MYLQSCVQASQSIMVVFCAEKQLVYKFIIIVSGLVLYSPYYMYLPLNVLPNLCILFTIIVNNKKQTHIHAIAYMYIINVVMTG